MINPILHRCAGLDVHRKTVVVTVLMGLNEEQQSINKVSREYGTFKKELQKLAQWLSSLNLQLTVMESTGIFWQPVYEALEAAHVPCAVVNARHVKNVPGRKTDIQDSEWLAELARCGLLRASFIPPRNLRQLRMLTRYRLKLVGMASSEKNRLHKLLESAGVKLGCVVSDIDGVSARAMIADLIEGIHTPEQIAQHAKGVMRKKEAELIASMQDSLSDRHRQVLQHIHRHLSWLEQELNAIDEQVVTALEPYREQMQLLQTIPGIDQIAAAMLLTEIGPEMKHFGNKDRLSSWAGICPGNNESAGKKNLDAPAKAIAISDRSSVNAPIAPADRPVNLKANTMR